LTDEQGCKTAVQIPFEEWQQFIEEYHHLQQYATLKKGIIDAFEEIRDIETGNKHAVTLEEFLNEY
jgi:hypothetical protein